MIEAKVDVNKWLRELGVASNKIKSVSKAIFSDVVTQVYNKTIENTPVGNPALWKYPAPSNYHPGTLKKSWGLELEDNKATISNNQPYAERVEYGWSTQAPQGMLRKAIAQYSGLLSTTAFKYKI